jgi:hypothetical protein
MSKSPQDAGFELGYTTLQDQPKDLLDLSSLAHLVTEEDLRWDL